MAHQERPDLPAAPVTPAMPGGAFDDDDSPTTQIHPRPPAWTGSAAVPERPADDEDTRHDTLDLPARERRPGFLERWGFRQRRDAEPQVGAPPTSGPPTSGPPHPGQWQGYPPHAYGAPPGHPGHGYPPAGYGPPPGYPPPGHAGYGPQGHAGYGPQGHAGYGPQGHPGHGPQGATGAPARRGRFGRRPQQQRPAGYGPPGGYGPPPPPRRRSRFPFKTVTFLALTVACCGGIIGWARPFVDEYPASISAGAAVPGLTPTTDAARRKAAEELAGVIEADQLDEKSFPLIWNDNNKRAVTVAATTRFVQNPGKDLDARFGELTERLKLGAPTKVDPGPLAGQMRCAAGSSGGRDAAVCGWADHGSLAVGVFPGRSTNEAAELLRTIRSSVLQRD
ncbi:hypothetical protein Val02_65910 [Virgisporangium aliadipatigenens]|uniref:Uncharacterized protein n=1 Tax=Virgisporangium aliadipatigenens TaxID=741659 RepID=A0A8J4DSX5_9ACTN|nr:hypothetical protein [Virgisporangium aliadipatigenens]GIJ49705.1 hypothetical protein Val02_65910 [Virgisporangium aliadipatigenens]